MFYKINNSLVKYLGVKINKSKPVPSPSSHENKIIVEFMGVSGVGKTTLLNYYLNNQSSVKKDRIINLLQIAKLWDYSTINLPSKYDILLKDKIKTIAQMPYFGNTQYSLINKAVNSMKRDLVATQSFTNKLVIIDEGILHKTNEVLINYSFEDIKPFVDNKLIVYCDATEEEIARRLISRQKKINAVGLDEKSYTQLVNSKKSLDRLFELLKENNIPIIRLNLEEEQDENLKKIVNFIK